MLIKIHQSYRNVVAICDSELLGKQFEEGDKLLDVRANFFNGEKKKKKELIEIIKDFCKEDATFNIIGKQAIQAALKAGAISKDGIKEVAGIPFALVLM